MLELNIVSLSSAKLSRQVLIDALYGTHHRFPLVVWSLSSFHGRILFEPATEQLVLAKAVRMIVYVETWSRQDPMHASKPLTAVKLHIVSKEEIEWNPSGGQVSTKCHQIYKQTKKYTIDVVFYARLVRFHAL